MSLLFVLLLLLRLFVYFVVMTILSFILMLIIMTIINNIPVLKEFIIGGGENYLIVSLQLFSYIALISYIGSVYVIFSFKKPFGIK